MKTLIIAEAGVNHNGDLQLAKNLVDVAADAGADVIKFQSFCADRIVTRTAPKADYQNKTTSNVESQHQMLRRLELSHSMHVDIIRHCKTRGIEFLSTGFDIESVDFLVGLGQQRFKIPSGEITNLPYLRHIGALRRPIILSTGMADIKEIHAAISAIELAGTSKSLLKVLHCTTEYPAPMNEVNLLAMLNIQEECGVGVGYSDHTRGIEVAIAAVALGATVIEKHITIDRNLPGPDHKASLEPQELRSMVHAIRNIEMALGDGIKRPTASEIKNRKIARKSLVACAVIRKGDKFSANNITAKRPGTGISPMLWDEIINSISTRDYSPDDLI